MVIFSPDFEKTAKTSLFENVNGRIRGEKAIFGSRQMQMIRLILVGHSHFQTQSIRLYKGLRKFLFITRDT
jgi:hypothetical protein